MSGIFKRQSRYGNYTLTLACVSLLIGCDQPPETQRFEFSGNTMGTYYRVSVIERANANLATVKDDIEAILEKINSQMSTYIGDSEISEFNNSRSQQWFDVSPELATVSRKAKQIYLQSGGHFDPTIGPVVNLWSFGPDQVPTTVPSDADLNRLKSAVGSDKLKIREHPPALKKLHDGLELDLSAIAKGYAVDKIAEYLVSVRQADFLIDIGGELRASGKNLAGESWRVGIEKPQSGLPQSVQIVVSISGKGIATSGSYRNYFEQDNKRYSHIINPQTGYPIEHKLVSASVISDDCMSADAYATALMVLGPQDGYDFALQYGLAVYMIEKKDDDFVTKYTPQMQAYME